MTPIAQIIDLARISHHRIDGAGLTFSIPPSDNISTWNNNITYLRDGEIGINLTDQIAYMRIGGDIVQIFPSGGGGLPSGSPNQILVLDNSNTPVFTGILKDVAGIDSVDPFNRSLYDDAGNTESLNWGTGLLSDASDEPSENWFNRILFDHFGKTASNWDKRQLFDQNNIQVFDWQNRRLIDSSNTIIFDWNTAGQLHLLTGSVSINLVPYHFPNSQTSGVLTNDGSGNLSWTASGGGSITGSPSQVLYFDQSGNVTSDSNFRRQLENSTTIRDSGSDNLGGTTNLSFQISSSASNNGLANQMIIINDTTTQLGLDGIQCDPDTGSVSSILVQGNQNTQIFNGFIVDETGCHFGLIDTNPVVPTAYFTLPPVDGLSGDVIFTNGSGILSFTSSPKLPIGTPQYVLYTDPMGNPGWESTLNDSTGIISLDFFNRLLKYASSGNISIDYESAILNDSSGNPSILYNGRSTYDINGVIAIDWNLGARFLYDNTGTASIDYGSRLMFDQNNFNSIAWNARVLTDSGGTESSLNWTDRNLLSSTASPVLNWNDTVTIGGIQNGTTLAVKQNGDFKFTDAMSSGNTLDVSGSSATFDGGEGFQVLYTDIPSGDFGLIEVGNDPVNGTASVAIGSIGATANYMVFNQNGTFITSNDIMFTFPQSDAGNGEVMFTNGSGVLGFKPATIPYVYSTQSDSFVYPIINNTINVIDTTGSVVTSCSFDVPNAPNDGDIFELKILGSGLTGVSFFPSVSGANVIYPPTALPASNQVYKWVYDVNLNLFV